MVLMKLERERGAQLELSGKEGERTFNMSVLNDLVLTDGTRLFKSAMFIRTGTGDDDFKSQACEGQYPVFSAEDLAKFWMRFLGVWLSRRTPRDNAPFLRVHAGLYQQRCYRGDSEGRDL